MVLISFTTFSCKTAGSYESKEQSHAEVDQVHDAAFYRSKIKERFIYDPQKDIYYSGSLFTWTTENFAYVKGMTRKAFTDYFGKPSRENKDQLIYFTDAQCHKTPDQCGRVIFLLDADERLNSFELSNPGQ